MTLLRRNGILIFGILLVVAAAVGIATAYVSSLTGPLDIRGALESENAVSSGILPASQDAWLVAAAVGVVLIVGWIGYRIGRRSKRTELAAN